MHKKIIRKSKKTIINLSLRKLIVLADNKNVYEKILLKKKNEKWKIEKWKATK